MGFKSRLSFGQIGQNTIIKFLEKNFGYRFEAGEYNGNLVNTDLIEELEGCEYVPPKTYSGAKLKFKKDKKEYLLTMPDVFMSRNSSSKFYWIEAKRHEYDSTEFMIDCDNFDDYKILYEQFTRQGFYVMCLNPIGIDGTHYDLYSCEISSLIKTKPNILTKRGNNVYVWKIDDVMTKINKYPISRKVYE